MRSAMQTAGHTLEQQSDSITNTIVTDLVQQCAQVLKQLQGIMVTYRSVDYLPASSTSSYTSWPIGSSPKAAGVFYCNH